MNILVIIAHPDDEVLGMGGTILKHAKNGDRVTVAYLTTGITSRRSINYKTNVQGKHTEWEFFNKDKEFHILLFQIIDHLEALKINFQPFFLHSSWGIIEGLGEHTQKHHHEPEYLSGALYLNAHPQKLYFPDIQQEITPEIGRFAVFSSFLSHHTKRNLIEKEKYAISFNFRSSAVK